MENLENCLKKRLPHLDIRPLAQSFSITKRLKKNEFLVRPGQQSAFVAYLSTGAFRVFYDNEEHQEITTWFSFQNAFVTDLLAYYKETPATFYIQALENSQVLIAPKKDLEELYLREAKLQAFGRQFAENGMVLVMERMMSLQCKTATMRYLELLEQPQFLRKIPLKHLASYLGVTDSSLSRIRRNLSASKDKPA